MAETAWIPMGWIDGDTVNLTKLNQMVSNDNFLHDHMFDAHYSAFGVNSGIGVKMISGIIYLAKSDTKYTSASVSFANVFSQGCQPVVTTGVYANYNAALCARVMATDGSVVPNNTGCIVGVYNAYAADTAVEACYCSWSAVGY